MTSMDWDKNSPLIVTSSIDSTCTVWDLIKMKEHSQFLAHEKTVYDVQIKQLSQNSFLLTTVGADGQAKCFDLRCKNFFVLYKN